MKKFFILMLTLGGLLTSCQKDSPEAAAPASSNGGGTTGSGSTGTGTPGAAGFSAKFTVQVPDPNNIWEKQNIKFINGTTGVVKYEWVFGNGTKSGQANPTISYSIHGYYPVNLTITDA
ncbi:MAG TPA: PKD domain-containing protein, partial [Ferruginibacter sp.]|nr:PKD domain-containing protein [Ferruginibacter sp.]